MRSDVRTWTLRDRGRDLAVEVWTGTGRNHARLLIGGDEAAAGDTDAIGDVKLSGDGTHVKVSFWWKGRVTAVDLIDRDDTESDADPFAGLRRAMRVPFVPPPGTRAARVHAWREQHPRLWAARHVAIQVGSILVAVLGISALLNGLLGRLLPAIDWSWVPEIRLPQWLEYLNPFHWIGKVIPDRDWFGWVPDIQIPEMGWLKYVVILLVALATGWAELRKRKERERREAALDEDASRDDLSP